MSLDYYKNGPHGKLFCKFKDCYAASDSNCGGLCREHHKSIIDGVESEPYPLVLPEERDTMPEDLYVALEQMVPCTFGASEKRVGNEAAVLGFPGVACKHCMGKRKRQDTGRFFPSSESAMYYASFANSIMRHLLGCAHCPNEVRSVS